MNKEEYHNTIIKAKVADYGPVHGNIVILPYGMGIWNLIKHQLNDLLEKTGHQQIYLPMFMPRRFLDEEREYVPGLSPRCFSVTEAGDKKLAEPLAIRPTSETLACYMFSKWINSYRDLPMRVFQWCNIARWEEATQPFIKETEIQWLEGHTVHATHEDAQAEINLVIDIFKTFMESILCLPVSVGLESEGNKFVGSLSTTTFEIMTPGGRSLQIGAVYDLGRVFTEHFNVAFHNSNNTKEFCWMTDWGLGFRLIGAVALLHGDERGLRLPSAIAPVQVVLLLLNSNMNLGREIGECAEVIGQQLKRNGIRTATDVVGSRTFNQALSDWEMKGVPVVIPIGDVEIQTREFQLRRRDRGPKHNRTYCTADALAETVTNLLRDIMNTLYQNSLTMKQHHMLVSDSYDEMRHLLDNNWVAAGWCGKKECETQIVNTDGQILRWIEQDKDFIRNHHRCIVCGMDSQVKAVFAKKY